jgi:serine carboxypeptidase-like clade 1
MLAVRRSSTSSSSSSSGGGSSRQQHGEITSLPGYSGQLRSRHFGGYITVDEDHDRNLYYYMVRRIASSCNDSITAYM